MLDPRTPAVEVWVDEEEEALAALSTATLEYMHGYWSGFGGWLKHHYGNLRFLAEEERDLFEAMRLSARLTRVESNMSRVGRRAERLRAVLTARACARAHGGDTADSDFTAAGPRGRRSEAESR